MDSIPEFFINDKIMDDLRVLSLSAKQVRTWLFAFAFSVSKGTPAYISPRDIDELCSKLSIKRRELAKITAVLHSLDLIHLHREGGITFLAFDLINFRIPGNDLVPGTTGGED